MIKIPLTSRTFANANILRIDVGTNCPCGGDAGHGGRTVLRFVNEGATNMHVRIDGGASLSPDQIELVFGGDTENETLIQALEFAVAALKMPPEPSSSVAEVE
jgi:hypothetical protein